MQSIPRTRGGEIVERRPVRICSSQGGGESRSGGRGETGK